jgi:hypothetical protein
MRDQRTRSGPAYTVNYPKVRPKRVVENLQDTISDLRNKCYGLEQQLHFVNDQRLKDARYAAVRAECKQTIFKAEKQQQHKFDSLTARLHTSIGAHAECDHNIQRAVDDMKAAKASEGRAVTAQEEANAKRFQVIEAYRQLQEENRELTSSLAESQSEADRYRRSYQEVLHRAENAQKQLGDQKRVVDRLKTTRLDELADRESKLTEAKGYHAVELKDLHARVKELTDGLKAATASVAEAKFEHKQNMARVVEREEAAAKEFKSMELCRDNEAELRAEKAWRDEARLQAAQRLGKCRVHSGMNFAAKGKGCIVSKVVNGTFASDAGMERGDLIMTCNDEEVVNRAGINAIIAKFRAGQFISLRVARSKVIFKVELRLGTPDFTKPQILMMSHVLEASPRDYKKERWDELDAQSDGEVE